ncbi:type II secretion system F family protein [Halomonas sp. DP8Y7-1]|uniref:type II secretion system F family protein n=1 Tax=Halomonas sp. DP8Y7-1 TaxID=2859078 RepID=UPI0021BD64C0|nr:type II secretion system F family protein [Halomonas sp. DP8Y7-1]
MPFRDRSSSPSSSPVYRDHRPSNGDGPGSDPRPGSGSGPGSGAGHGDNHSGADDGTRLIAGLPTGRERATSPPPTVDAFHHPIGGPGVRPDVRSGARADTAGRSRAAQQRQLCWKWKGEDRQGLACTGMLLASKRPDAQRQLHLLGITPRKLKPAGKLVRYQRQIKPRDLMLFSRQLATLLTAGVPLLEAFRVLSDSLSNPAMRLIVQALGMDVSAGASLAQALSRQGAAFDSLYVNLVAAGEQSGTLDQMLDRLANHLEKRELLKGRVRKALWYPATVVAVGIAVSAILLIKVVPQFEQMFDGVGASLPAMTQWTILLSEFAQRWWLVTLGSLFTLVATVRWRVAKSQAARLKLHALSLRLPVVGTILDHAAVARFCRTLATAFAAGVPLVTALRTAAGACGNDVYRRAVLALQADVASGQRLHLAMRRTQRFPSLALQMVAIGEEAGALDGMLSRVADHYEREVDDRVDTLTSLLEPLIIVVLGVVVGGLVLAMYLPIFQLGNVV